MITLDHWDSQIVLYCKGHFAEWRCKGVVEDLKKLVGQRNAIDAADIDDKALVVSLLDVMRAYEIMVEEKCVLAVMFTSVEELVTGKYKVMRTGLERFCRYARDRLHTMPVRDREGKGLIELAGLDVTAMN